MLYGVERMYVSWACLLLRTQADVGQGDDMEEAREKATKLGAKKVCD